MTGARVLRDDRLDERLREDGFVVLPLLAPAAVAELRTIFTDVRGWDGEGFQADLQTPDPEYKRKVNAALGGALEAQVTAPFVDHRPFLYNFLCKFPGEDSELYLHRDWMYVDERQGHRTFVAWIALQDVEGDNGRLRVLPGSHRVDGSLRGTDLIAPWLDHGAVIAERLVPLDVPAGSCVVIDNGLAHCSFPNLTAEPRLVAAVGLRPAAAPLVHFLRQGDASAVRYDVDEDFFCEHTPQDLLAGPPRLPVAETIADDQVHLGAAALAAILDGRDPDAAPAPAVAGVVDGRARNVLPLSSAGRQGLGAGPPKRVLVITAAPDDRPSTPVLRDVAAEIARRPSVKRVDTWLLTDPDGLAWPGARVIDGPFTAPVLRNVSSPRSSLARRLRGIRRHVWLLAARPDLIVFDDGLGEPLVRRWTGGHLRVARVNARPPTNVPPDLGAVIPDPDLVIAGLGVVPPSGVPTLDEPEFYGRDINDVDPAQHRRDARRALGLDADAQVVVGIGTDGWVDGPELFLRALWSVNHRHGLDVHGVWIMRHTLADELAPLQAEAARCGLSDRIHFVPADPDLDLRWAGGVALLPYREAGDRADIRSFLERGASVVSFPVWDFEHPRLQVVAHLDLEAAADAVVALLGAERDRGADPAAEPATGPTAATGGRLRTWVDQVLTSAEARRA